MNSKLLFAIIVLLGVGGAVYYAAECGSSGNTYWTATASNLSVVLVTDATNIYWTSGTTVEARDMLGIQSWARDFPNVTLSRPLPFERATDSARLLIVTGSDGYVYCLDRADGVTLWSHGVRRLTCSADSIIAAPVIQLRHSSDTNFQAVISSDLVIVATAFGCSTTTANKVYGLSAATGNVIWAHNGTGTYSYDTFSGLAVDYARNTVYATAHKTIATGSQNTVVALNTITGARRWGVDLGSIYAAPILANGGLYVANRAGILFKLDADTGAMIWSTTLASAGAQITQDFAVDASRNAIYVVDSGGTLHAVLDTCSGFNNLWSSTLSGGSATVRPAILSVSLKVYVGAANGRVYQLDATSGATDSYATVSDSSVATTDVLFLHDPVVPASRGGFRLLAASGGVVKYFCIPWAADGMNKASAVTISQCADSGAPDGGLVIHGDLGAVTNVSGQRVTRLLTVANTTCYPFQCVNLFGTIPSGSGILSLTSTNAAVINDVESFLAQPIGGLPMTASLAVTSSVPGFYVSTVTVSNASTLHTTVLLTNYVVLPPVVAIALNGGQVELAWTTNSAGYQLECAPNLGAVGVWQAVTNGITTAAGAYHYAITNITSPARFYRLHLP